MHLKPCSVVSNTDGNRAHAVPEQSLRVELVIGEPSVGNRRWHLCCSCQLPPATAKETMFQ